MVVGVGLGPDRDATESPPVDLPHEAGVLGLVEVTGQHRLGELGHVQNLPAAAVRKPRDGPVQLRIGQDVEEGRGEGRLVARAGLGLAAAAALPGGVGAGRVQTSAGPVERLVDVLLCGTVGDRRAVDVLGMDKTDLERAADSIREGVKGGRELIRVFQIRKRRRRRSSALAVVLHVLLYADAAACTSRSGQGQGQGQGRIDRRASCAGSAEGISISRPSMVSESWPDVIVARCVSIHALLLCVWPCRIKFRPVAGRR
mmetsp:Transcript_26866/g.77456  ORF Transcript_26866/g.77456 Transcript_26866/m.77456 type:complete len:258 (+) Transcript_26866:1508-2281(+)